MHNQFSWDALAGSMQATCERAVQIGLPALPPPLDLTGYRECLDRCRLQFPQLRILSGVELGEPHWHKPAATTLLTTGPFDRVLASVHSVTIGPVTAEIAHFLANGHTDADTNDAGTNDAPAKAMRVYLTEAAALVSQFHAYDVLAHIDYPVRNWPAAAKPFDPLDFQEEYRRVLRLLARAGKALEVNTKVPLHPQILAWWREDGGQAITFASDAHRPDALAAGFATGRG